MLLLLVALPGKRPITIWPITASILKMSSPSLMLSAMCGQHLDRTLCAKLHESTAFCREFPAGSGCERTKSKAACDENHARPFLISAIWLNELVWRMCGDFVGGNQAKCVWMRWLRASKMASISGERAFSMMVARPKTLTLKSREWVILVWLAWPVDWGVAVRWPVVA